MNSNFRQFTRLDPVRSGDPIPKGWHSSLVEAINQLGLSEAGLNADRILIHNDTGSDLTAYQVVSCKHASNPFQNQFIVFSISGAGTGDKVALIGPDGLKAGGYQRWLDLTQPQLAQADPSGTWVLGSKVVKAESNLFIEPQDEDSSSREYFIILTQPEVSGAAWVYQPVGAGTDSSGDGNGGGEGCCCCESVDYPDVTLSDGTRTTRRRELCEKYGIIEEDQTNDDGKLIGTLKIDLPAPEDMLLEVDTAVSDEFEWEIPKERFSATRIGDPDGLAAPEEGETATDEWDNWEPSGSVIFRHSVSGGYCCDGMEFEIEWDADIPEYTPPES